MNKIKNYKFSVFLSVLIIIVTLFGFEVRAAHKEEVKALSATMTPVKPLVLVDDSPVVSYERIPVIAPQVVPAKTVEIKTPVVHAPNSRDSLPDRLIIPTLGVNASIKGMGLTREGKMAVPSNYIDVGWFNLGPKPGQNGTAMIGAHVDNGSSVNGVFKNLKSLKPGDVLNVRMSDGTDARYRVTNSKSYPRNTKFPPEAYEIGGRSRLNLITCHGKWIPGENTYEERLVVFTELI